MHVCMYYIVGADDNEYRLLSFSARVRPDTILCTIKHLNACTHVYACTTEARYIYVYTDSRDKTCLNINRKHASYVRVRCVHR